MLKRGLMIVVLLLALLPLRAQVQERIVRVGICLGPGLSTLISDDDYLSRQYQWRFRFHASVFQDIYIKKPFYIHTEVNYTAAGTMYPVDLTDTSGNVTGQGAYKYNLHYIQVPVMGKFKFGNTVKGYVAAGPYIGFLVGARGGLDADNGITGGYPTVDLLDQYNSIDLGMRLHTGVEVPILNEQRLLIEARYNQGFWDVSNALPRDWNGAFSLMVGYMFEL